jgi:hypothetical protein
MERGGKKKKKKRSHARSKKWEKSYLEGLRIPVLDLFDRWHIAEAIGQFAQVLDSVGEANGKLLGEKLGCAEESA